eukprot:8181981-Ditylum_brightwellii.AAC.1
MDTKGGAMVKWAMGTEQVFYYMPDTQAIKSTQYPGLCLDYDFGGSSSRVYMHTCHGGSNQRWTYNNSTQLVKADYDSSKCLDWN